MGTMTLFALLFILATFPGVARLFLPPLPRTDARVRPRAVVVLGAGYSRRGGDHQSSVSGLRRTNVAMHVAREMQLPLLISGGGKHPEGVPAEAELMAEALRHQWPDGQPWLECDSRNTWENARNSAVLLREKGIEDIVLVTDQAHLCRAVLCFQQQGLRVRPVAASQLPAPDWVPSAGTLSALPGIYYEWLAILWYYLKYLR